MQRQKVKKTFRDLVIEEPKKIESKKRKREDNQEVLFCLKKFSTKKEIKSYKIQKKTWILIDTIQGKEIDSYLMGYQAEESVVLLSKKTKKNINTKDYIYKCQNEKCPFEMKLSESDIKVEVYTTMKHNHDTTLITIGMFFFINIKYDRSSRKKWNRQKN